MKFIRQRNVFKENQQNKYKMIFMLRTNAVSVSTDCFFHHSNWSTFINTVSQPASQMRKLSLPPLLLLPYPTPGKNSGKGRKGGNGKYRWEVLLLE